MEPQQQEIHGLYAAVDAYARMPEEFKREQLKEIRSLWEGAYNIQGEIGPGQFVVQLFYGGPRFGLTADENKEREFVHWLSGVIPRDFHVLPYDDLQIEESIGHLDLRLGEHPEVDNLHKLVKFEGLPHKHWLQDQGAGAEPVATL